LLLQGRGDEGLEGEAGPGRQRGGERKAYREDARYKATLAPATISGTIAEVTPSITQNDTGFAAPENWWDVSETIPNSQAIDTVTVKCGDATVATIKLQRQK